MNLRSNIVKCLEQNGIIVNDEGDLLQVESINFISALLDIELEFSIEIPDELLSFETMSNIKQIENIVNTLQV